MPVDLLGTRLDMPSLGVLLLAMALPGCVPTTWLPDSSGFVYVKPIKGKGPRAQVTGGQKVHFDLRSKAGRVVVADIGPGTIWPAISPDGQRIAVARFKGELGEATTGQIVLYDLQGKQLDESKEFVWAPADPKRFEAPSGTMLFWSPQNDMLVVWNAKSTGLYNPQKGTMKVLDKTTAVVHAGTPILPDGSGVLLIITEGDPKDKKARLVVMDWAGNEQKIDIASLETAVKDKKGDLGTKELALFSLVLPSWWEGNTAFAGRQRDKLTYKIDTAKKMLSLSEGFATLLKSDKTPGNVIPISFDFASGVSVKLEPFEG
jgi:hypothetical protein